MNQLYLAILISIKHRFSHKARLVAQQRPLFNKNHIFVLKSARVTFMTEFSDFRSSRLSEEPGAGRGAGRARGSPDLLGAGGCVELARPLCPLTVASRRPTRLLEFLFCAYYSRISARCISYNNFLFDY